jgi:hypothetical protein
MGLIVPFFSLLSFMDIKAIQERNSSLQDRIQETVEALEKQCPNSFENRTVRYKRRSSTHARLLIGQNYFHFFWSGDYWVCVKRRHLVFYDYSF